MHKSCSMTLLTLAGTICASPLRGHQYGFECNCHLERFRNLPSEHPSNGLRRLAHLVWS